MCQKEIVIENSKNKRKANLGSIQMTLKNWPEIYKKPQTEVSKNDANGNTRMMYPE